MKSNPKSRLCDPHGFAHDIHSGLSGITFSENLA